MVQHGFNCLLRRADARRSADIVYSTWRISLLWGQA